MPRVAIYCRLSDEDRNKVNSTDDSESIQNQKTILTRYAAEQGWDIYRIYSDEDYSGLDIDRPEWNCLLKDAEAGRFHIVLCKSQSRFTRDMELAERYLHNRFVAWGIRFIGLTDHSDTSEKGNKKQRQIIGLTNEWYCEDISENIRAVFDAKRSEGRFIGSFAAYGYKKDPLDKNRLVIDEDAAMVVRMIFRRYMEGYGTRQIASLLNAAHIPNPAFYKRNAGLPFANSHRMYEGGLWSRTTVRRILENEVYIGNMVQGKRKKLSYKSPKIVSTPRNQWFRVENTHEPILEKELFSEVQRRISGRQKSSGSGQAHIFSTKIRCLDCGRSMNKVTAPGTAGRVYSYLRCSTYMAASESAFCTSHTIRMDVLNDIITARLREYAGHYLDEEAVCDSLQDQFSHSKQIQNYKKEAEDIHKQLQLNTGALKMLYADRVENAISQEQFSELNRSFSEDRNRLVRRAEELKQWLSEWDAALLDKNRWLDVIRQYIGFNSLDNTIIHALIDYIEIGERNPVSGEQKISIHWLF